MKKDGMKKQWIEHANDIVAANLSVLSWVLKSISFFAILYSEGL